jgi:hypothetical protein
MSPDVHCELDEISALLGNYTAYGCNSLPTCRDKLSAPTIRFGKKLQIYTV